MNKVMYGENRRRGGRNMLCRLLRSGRWFLCLALLCSVMLPGFASAAEPVPATAQCTDWNNSQGDIQLKLPASVTIQPGMVDIPPIPSVTVKYKCSVPDSNNHTVAIVSLADAHNLIGSLKSLGLTLKMTITDSSGGTVGHWTFPAPGGGIYPEYVAIGDSYKGNDGTGERTMTIDATLSRNPSQSTRPGFYAIPSLSAFRLKPYYNYGSGPLLTSPAIRLQYVPTCFVRFQLDKNNINFGPVMTTDVDSSFSRRDNFTVTADVNPNCNSGQFGNLLGGYTPQLTGAQTYYLDLPLKVSFTLQGGGYISGNSILLYKQDTLTKNGLKLTITDPDNHPVKFGEIISPDAQSLPGNKLGEFSNGNFNAKKIYNVKLSATGEPALTGKYNAQVLVKVEYY
ncbi:hypothetical protein VWU69_002138 [Salmonella enterica]|uniref:hypothetical protein n=1 Tax=Salmonella enterica TaxID=28901 RepID=UPI000DEC6362|nr:hypothetical protein [Salmonella enterica]EAA5437697.1 hypothetical protein [Salmonella enterica subsp. diarizonae]EBR3877053.1 hypothetical protein [Salmonella enterica subsp. arizonae]AXD10118.1 hypothetical protein CHE29_15045 [Salmonella enterica]ECJ5906823.1 hypothetical protein [Salmonella enterica subsp. diarizonae]ECJ8077728.1 hypothetical protein [Salmonella enterica]